MPPPNVNPEAIKVLDAKVARAETQTEALKPLTEDGEESNRQAGLHSPAQNALKQFGSDHTVTHNDTASKYEFVTTTPWVEDPAQRDGDQQVHFRLKSSTFENGIRLQSKVSRPSPNGRDRLAVESNLAIFGTTWIEGAPAQLPVTVEGDDLYAFENFVPSSAPGFGELSDAVSLVFTGCQDTAARQAQVGVAAVGA